MGAAHEQKKGRQRPVDYTGRSRGPGPGVSNVGSLRELYHRKGDDRYLYVD